MSSDQKLEGVERDDLKDATFKTSCSPIAKHPSESRESAEVYERYPTVMSFIHAYNETQMSTKKLARLGHLGKRWRVPLQWRHRTGKDRFPNGDWFIVYDAVFFVRNQRVHCF